jgi:hypothetical protein
MKPAGARIGEPIKIDEERLERLRSGFRAMHRGGIQCTLLTKPTLTLRFGTILVCQHFGGHRREVSMRRRVDKDRIERANRESHLIIEAERQATEAKTARLREERLKKATEDLLLELNSPSALQAR